MIPLIIFSIHTQSDNVQCLHTMITHRVHTGIMYTLIIHTITMHTVTTHVEHTYNGQAHCDKYSDCPH